MLFTPLAPALAETHLVVPGHADARIADLVVQIAPDHADWTYSVGEEAEFHVSVLADGAPLDGVGIAYQLGPEKFEAEAKTAVVPADGLVIPAGTLDEPGVLRCIVTAEIDGRSYRALASACFDPESIEPTQVNPDDFDEFWEESKAELAKIPLAPEVTLLPEECTPEVNVYHVSIQTWGSDGRPTRVYGMLTEPKAPGSYPLGLRVPGAGVRSYSGQKSLSAKGMIILEIGIHGIPVNLTERLYEELRRGALDYYPSFNLDNRDDYYYRRVYLACVRANDFLVSREQWDGETLVVFGGSQGGQLSIVTAALDPRVTGLVSDYPAYCDVTGYLHGRAGGWPHLLRNERHQTPAKIKTTGYYDTVNFARRLEVPGSYGWGYNDETCPVTSLYAAYNTITAPKSLVLDLEMGHGSSPEFRDRFNERVLEMAGIE